MPDNDDLRNRLVALEQQLGLTTRNDNHIQANTDTNVSANINWRALYKWLESEVEEMIFDPQAPQYLKDWGSKILSEARSKLNLLQLPSRAGKSGELSPLFLFHPITFQAAAHQCTRQQVIPVRLPKSTLGTYNQDQTPYLVVKTPTPPDSQSRVQAQ